MTDFTQEVKDLRKTMKGWTEIKELGATGRFPDGKMTSHDEGEIAFGIYSRGNVLILEFNKPVKWLGMGKAQAAQLGKILIEHAKRGPIVAKTLTPEQLEHFIQEQGELLSPEEAEELRNRIAKFERMKDGAGRQESDGAENSGG